MLVQITNLSKAMLLCALFNNAKIVTGCDPVHSAQMKISEAEQLMLRCQQTKNYRFTVIGHRRLEVDLAALSRLDVTEYERINRVRVNDIIGDLRANRQTYKGWDYVPALSEPKPELEPMSEPESEPPELHTSDASIGSGKMVVDISGFEKAAALVVFYNNAIPRNQTLSLPQAYTLLQNASSTSKVKHAPFYFDKLFGKKLYLNLGGSLIDVTRYNAANAVNAVTIFENVHNTLDETFGPPGSSLVLTHRAIHKYINRNNSNGNSR